jgi:uncharacterized membrane protein affecting hemolysin expression
VKSLLANYRLYPQLSLCACLLIALGIFGAFFYLHSSAKNQQNQIEHYGQLLAVSTARQAVDATLTQDMVSLQAILQDVAQYPNVIGATLHNIDNKLLVQSGYKPNQPNRGKRYDFTAPVALHNNVAGYLAVSIEVPSRSTQDNLFLVFWTLAVASALLIISWSIHRSWWSSFRDKLPSAKTIVTAVVDKLPNIPEAFSEADKSTSTSDGNNNSLSGVRLHIQISNLHKLHQQLNSEGFGVILLGFEKQLHKLLSLYNGKHQVFMGDILSIDFFDPDSHECSFRAICCAKILLDMVTQNASPRLQLACTIQPLPAIPTNTDQSLLNEFLIQHDNPILPIKNEIIISTHLLSEVLLEHASFELTDGKLIDIKPPYCDLIIKQKEQLLQS